MVKTHISDYRLLRCGPIFMLFLLLQVGAVSADPGDSPSRITQEWQARQEIAALQRRYAQATDLIARGGAANEAEVLSAYQQIFTEDAEMGVLNQLTRKGPIQWLALVKGRIAALASAQHMIGSQVVDIRSLPSREGRGGAATMSSYLQATHVSVDGTIERILGTYRSSAIYLPETGWRLSGMMLEVVSREIAEVAPSLRAESPN